ncbi:hypothetical protein D3C72_669930 [compost metagenome]
MQAETKVPTNSTYQELCDSPVNTSPTEMADSKSHHTMVSFGRHLSANVPPIMENISIGAYSTTEMRDTYLESLWVKSVT